MMSFFGLQAYSICFFSFKDFLLYYLFLFFKRLKAHNLVSFKENLHLLLILLFDCEFDWNSLNSIYCCSWNQQIFFLNNHLFPFLWFYWFNHIHWPNYLLKVIQIKYDYFNEKIGNVSSINITFKHHCLALQSYLIE